MAVETGYSKIVTRNSVFMYDTGDIFNSYLGEPTTNLVGSPFSVTSGYSTTVPTRTDNAILNWNGQNTGGLLSGTGWFAYTSAATTNGNQYTTSWYIKGGTLTTPYFGWGGAHQGNRTNFTFNTDTGAFSGVSQAAGEIYGANYLGNGWWRVYYSSTLTSGNNYYPELNTSGIFYVGGLQIEQKNHPTPFVVGTRSNTQGLLDISGIGNSISLANMSFNSNAQMVFDGTNDSISVSSFSLNPNTSGFTYEAIINSTIANTSYSTWKNLFSFGGGSNFYGILVESDSRGYRLDVPDNSGNRQGVTTNITLAANTNYHIAWSWLNGVFKFYVNGVLQVNSSIGAYPAPNITSMAFGTGINVSNGYWYGLQNMSKVYNRVLTDAEVLTNFNHYRTRFNIT